MTRWTAENTVMGRYVGALRPLLLISLLPCVLASLLTFAANGLFGGLAGALRVFHSFLTLTALTPLVTLAAAGVTVIPLKRWAILTARQHWEAGFWVALTSLVGMALTGAALGGVYQLYLSVAWSVASGYIGFVWIGGAYLWRSLDSFGPAAAPDESHCRVPERG
jgi:hypothetical protein